MTPFEIASLSTMNAQVWVAGLVGVGQITLIGWGILTMKASNLVRDKRHEESMLALRTLIERTASPEA